MKTTIKDIAKMAGVSPSTVSRALQNNPRISESVRTRIQNLATEMKFTPNQIARSLVKQKSRIVGIVFPSEASLSLGHPFFPQVLQGIGHAAGEKGYHILLGTGSQETTIAQTSIEVLNSGYVSGLIVLATENIPATHLDIPVVYVGHPVGEENPCYVDTDNIKAGNEITKHLIERGHRRILFLGYDQKYIVTMDRFTGYQQALSSAKIPFAKDLVASSRFLHHQTDPQTDLSKLATLFASKDRPTAVVSMDDALAIGLIGFLKERGLQCPKDVSVVSFNNTQAGQYHSPSLTSVDISPYRLGEHAMQMMLGLIKGEKQAPQSILVPFEIIERNSVLPLSEEA